MYIWEVITITAAIDKVQVTNLPKDKKHSTVRGYIKTKAEDSIVKNNPLQTHVSLILTDFLPNKNRQAIPRSEAENLIRSSVNMPLMINFDGEDYYGHAGAIPIGPITSAYIDTIDGNEVIKAEAIIWADQFPEVSDHLKSLFSEGIGTSWEIYYGDSYKDTAEVEWLQDCIFSNTCVVDTPAYGPERTRVLAIAEHMSKQTANASELHLAKSESVSTPQWMRNNARRGLKWHEEGKSGDGVTAQTVREARQMAEGSVSLDKAKRMAAWFARHMVDLNAPAAKPGNDKFPSPGVVAHALWGGGSRTSSMRAMNWAERVSKKEQSTLHMNNEINSTADSAVESTIDPNTVVNDTVTDTVSDTIATSNMNGDEGYEEDSIQSEFRDALEMLMEIYDRLANMENEALQLEEARKRKKNYNIDSMAEAFNEVIAKLGTKMKDLRASAETLQVELTSIKQAEAERIRLEEERIAREALITTRKSAISSLELSDEFWNKNSEFILSLSDTLFATYVQSLGDLTALRAQAQVPSQSTGGVASASVHARIPEPLHTRSDDLSTSDLAKEIRKLLK